MSFSASFSREDKRINDSSSRDFQPVAATPVALRDTKKKKKKMDKVAGLLRRMEELREPLQHQLGLHNSLRQERLVESLHRERLKTQLTLIDVCCDEAVNLLQNGQTSWSLHCLSFSASTASVDAALRLVKLAEIVFAAPAVQHCYGALARTESRFLELLRQGQQEDRQTSIMHTSNATIHKGMAVAVGIDDQRVARAFRLLAHFRFAVVLHTAAAVHFARGRFLLAVAYATKCWSELLADQEQLDALLSSPVKEQVVATHAHTVVVENPEERTISNSVHAGLHAGAEEVGGVSRAVTTTERVLQELLLAALDVSFLLDHTHLLHPDLDARALLGFRLDSKPTAAAEMLVSMLSSFSVMLLRAEKLQQAVVVGAASRFAACALLDEVYLRRTSALGDDGNNSFAATHVCDSVRLLECLVVYNFYRVRLLASELAPHVGVPWTCTRFLCEESAEEQGIRVATVQRCLSTAVTLLGPRHAFTERLHAMWFESSRCSAAPPPTHKQRRGKEVREATDRNLWLLLHEELRTADNTLIAFQGVAGLLSQRRGQEQHVQKSKRRSTAASKRIDAFRATMPSQHTPHLVPKTAVVDELSAAADAAAMESNWTAVPAGTASVLSYL